MRFCIFVALLMAIMTACCSGFANADKTRVLASEDYNGRHLMNQVVTDKADEAAAAVTRLFGTDADEKTMKYANKLMGAADKNPAAVKKALNDAAFVRAAMKVDGADVEKLMAIVKQAKGPEGDAMRQIIGLIPKAGKTMSGETTTAVSTKVADVLTKQPKSRSRMAKFLKYAFGATVGGFALYGAYKLIAGDSPAAAATTTTTG